MDKDSILQRAKYLPLFLRSSEQRALLVGGGRGSLRKAQTLLHSGVECTILSPELCPELNQLVEEEKQKEHPRLLWQKSSFSPCLPMEEFTLVISATGIDAIDTEVCLMALRLGKLTTSLSHPDLGNIQFGAVGEAEGFQLAVRTEFRLPELAQTFRNRIVESLHIGLEEELKRLSLLRQKAINDPSPKHQTEYQNLKARIIDLL